MTTSPGLDLSPDPGTTIYRGRHVLPLGDRPTQVIDDAGVCVRDGRVAAIGPISDLRDEFPGAHQVGGSDRVVLPGLVDAHQHGRPVTAAGHGVADQPLELWLLEQRATPSLDPYLSALITGVRELTAGITAAAHPHLAGNPDAYGEDIIATVRGYQDAGLRAAVGMDVRNRATFTYDDDETFFATLPGPLADRARAYAAGARTPDLERIQQAMDAADSCAEGSLVHVGLAPRGPQWCDPGTLEWLAEQASRGSHLQTHCAETRAQYGHFARRGTSPVRFLADHGLLGSRTTLAHCVWLDQADVQVLAESGTHVVHNPASNLRLRSGISPVAALRSAGVSPALGSDSMGISDDHVDLFAAARLAFALERLSRRGDDTDAASRFVAHMSAGAGALGHPERLAGLRIGGPADLVLMDWDAVVTGMPADAAEADVVGTVLRRGTARFVNDVVVAGRHVVVDGHHVDHDLAALEAEVLDRLKTSGQVERRRLMKDLRGHVVEHTTDLATALPDDVFVGHPLR